MKMNFSNLGYIINAIPIAIATVGISFAVPIIIRQHIKKRGIGEKTDLLEPSVESASKNRDTENRIRKIQRSVSNLFKTDQESSYQEAG